MRKPLQWVNREYQVAFLMGFCAFFTLVGYEMIRSPATVLFKNTYGAESLPMVMAIMPVVVFAGVAAYGRLLSMVGPRRTLRITSLGSGVAVLICILLIQGGSEITTAILFLVKEFYIVLLIEQYWSFINSSLSTGTARRVNGPITGISGLGGVVGGFMVANLAEGLGTEMLIMLSAFFVIPSLLVAEIAYSLNGEPQVPETKTTHMGLGLFRESRILRYLLAIVVVTQVVSAVLDFKFQELLTIKFGGDTDLETAFQGWFIFTLNSSALVLQFVIAPLLLGFMSLRRVHILMPVIHLTAITFALVSPSIFSVGLALLLFKAFDYSIFRAAKEILYIPLSYDVRFRAKEVIDVFGYRTGKGASSIVIASLQRAGIALGSYYVWIAFFAVGLWLVLIFPLTRDAEATPQG